jgi:hypothetical protein
MVGAFMGGGMILPIDDFVKDPKRRKVYLDDFIPKALERYTIIPWNLVFLARFFTSSSLQLV